MPKFIIGILILAFIFCISFGLAFLIKFLNLYRKYKRDFAEKEYEKTDDGKVYFIKKTFTAPKRKKTTKPTVALSGIVIKPEEFKKYAESQKK